MVFAITAPGWLAGRQQPQIDCEIDWTHPVARNMVLCAMPTPLRGSILDMTGHQRTITPGVLLPHTYGISVNTWSVTNATTTDLDFTTGGWAVAVWAHTTVLATAFGSNPAAIGRQAYSSETVNTGWYLGAAGSPTTVTYWSTACFHNNASSLYQMSGTSTGYVGDAFLGTTSDGSTTRRLFVNGIQEASTANSLNPLSCASALTPFVPATGAFDGSYLMLAWNRDVIAPEWAWLNVEPYCFLKPRLQTSYFFATPRVTNLPWQQRGPLLAQ